MKTFGENQDLFLDEWLRLEGRGEPKMYEKCSGCTETSPRFRCEHQTCFGTGLFCQTCMVLRHQVLPTHWIEVCLPCAVRS